MFSHCFIILPNLLGNLRLGDAYRLDKKTRSENIEVTLQSRLEVLVNLICNQTK